MSTDNGGPAFPREDYQADDAPGQRGMTLRDYLAAKAMQALLTKWPPMEVTERERIALVRDLCDSAFTVADAMLAERSK